MILGTTAQRATASVMNSLFSHGIVENGLMHIRHDTEDNVTQTTADNLKDTKDKQVVKNNSLVSRPSSLVHEATFNSVARRFPAQTGGSLESSPDSSLDLDFHPLSGDSKSSSHSALDNDTKNLLDVFLHSYPDIKHSRCSQPKALTTMDRVVKSLVIKHEIAYKGLLAKLNLDERGDDMRFIYAVAKDIFSDGTTNWGRITSLVAFGAVLSNHLKTRGQEHCIDQVANQISSYLLSNQRDWLINNKEWDGFVEFFHVEDPESALKGALMTLAGVAGLGAGLAFLIR